MNFALSVYDVFAYAVPGAQYLGVTTYLLLRTGWVSPADLAGVPGTALLLVAIVVSYLLGHATYPLHHPTDRMVPRWRTSDADARRVFVERMPDAEGRPFLRVPMGVLLTAIETRSAESSLDIKRMRAMSLMLRGSVLPLMLAAAIGLAEIVIGTNVTLAVLATVTFGALALGALHHGQRAALWGSLKTLEVAYWIPDQDVVAVRRDAPTAPDS